MDEKKCDSHINDGVHDAEAAKLIKQVELGKYDGDGPEDVATVIDPIIITNDQLAS